MGLRGQKGVWGPKQVQETQMVSGDYNGFRPGTTMGWGPQWGPGGHNGGQQTTKWLGDHNVALGL